MIIYKELEPPSSVLAAWPEDPGCGAPGAADGACASALLLARPDRLSRAALGPDGTELGLAYDVLLPVPAVAAVPLPGGAVLTIGGDGTAYVLALPAAAACGASGSGFEAGNAPPAARARVLAEAPLQGPASNSAPREALAFGGCACSAPLTLSFGSGGIGASCGGSGISETTHVLVSHAHGVLQLVSWTPPGGGVASTSAGCGGEGQLDATGFRAAPALLTGGLPGAAQRLLLVVVLVRNLQMAAWGQCQTCATLVAM